MAFSKERANPSRNQEFLKKVYPYWYAWKSSCAGVRLGGAQ